MNALCWAEISLDALTHNFELVKEAAPDSKIMAVIKADAYGHSAIEASKALAGADAFAVARIHEALQLRHAGINKEIIILSGVLDAQDIVTCAAQQLTLVVHSSPCLELLKSATQPLDIWLKADTGMHRLGLDFEQLQHAKSLIQKSGINHRLRGLLTHLSDAEDVSNPKNEQQHQCLKALSTELQLPHLCLCNSAGLLFHPQMRHQWVRPGIMLYGANPSTETNNITQRLRPAMTVKAKVLDVKTVKQGEPVGYNETWRADKDSQIATIAIGYADGYPRHAGNGTPVLINDKYYPLAGRVSMDLITIDVSGGNVRPGDTATLWGEGLPAETIAEHAGTISYHLFTGIAARVEKRFLHG